MAKSFTEKLETLVEKLDEFRVECEEAGHEEAVDQVQSAITTLNEIAFADGTEDEETDE